MAEKDPAAVSLGRKGGIKGGPARARSLTQEERRAISQKAAQIRWAKEKKERRIAAGVEWGNPKDQS